MDLAPLLLAAASGQLPTAELAATRGVRVGVVLASGGYPGAMKTGYPITGLAEAGALDGVAVFHAGSRLRQVAGIAVDEVVTAGGRVLTVVGAGATLREARERAYQAVSHISFQDMHFRTDIAARYV